MSWLTEKLKQIMAKSEPIKNRPCEEKINNYGLVLSGETPGLIGEAVAEHIPADAIRDGCIFDINVVISGCYDLKEIHLKMRIDSGLCVQMMECPANG